MANLERRIVDTFWDLRDDAHDHPERWQGIEAEAVFQVLATLVEQQEESGASIDWPIVANRLIAWRETDIAD